MKHLSARRRITVAAVAALAVAAVTSQTALAAAPAGARAADLPQALTAARFAHLVTPAGADLRVPLETKVSRAEQGGTTVWSVTETLSVPKSTLESGTAPNGLVQPKDSTGGTHSDTSVSVTASLHLNYTSTKSGGHTYYAVVNDTASWARDTSVTWSGAVVRTGIGGHKTNGDYYGPKAATYTIGNPTSGHKYTYTPSWHGVYVRTDAGNNYQTVNSDIKLKYQGGSTYNLQFPPVTLGIIV